MPDTSTIERKTIELAELKALDGDQAPFGGLAGYASTYHTLDRVGDIVMPGAYDATLEAFIQDGFLAEAHDWDEPIGFILSARSDTKGLYFEAAFHDTERAQKVRRIVNERLKAGKSVSLSIGYRAEKYSYDRDDNRLLEAVSLYEVSVVTVPANPEAQVVSGKAAEAAQTDDAAFEEPETPEAPAREEAADTAQEDAVKAADILARYLSMDARLVGVDFF